MMKKTMGILGAVLVMGAMVVPSFAAMPKEAEAAKGSGLRQAARLQNVIEIDGDVTDADVEGLDQYTALTGGELTLEEIDKAASRLNEKVLEPGQDTGEQNVINTDGDVSDADVKGLDQYTVQTGDELTQEEIDKAAGELNEKVLHPAQQSQERGNADLLLKHVVK